MNEKDTCNPDGLLIIKTARTEATINEAATQGYWPLVKSVTPSPKIKSKYSVFQHKTTGVIQVIGDLRAEVTEEQVVAIDFTFYYPHHSSSPYAAYLIPKGLQVDQRVWLEDIIEDIVEYKWNQGDTFRLKSSEAIWNGKEFVIDFNHFMKAEMVG